jgi:H+-transporting ATPase
VVYGVVMVAESVGLLIIGRGILGTGARLQTLMFVWLVLSAYLTALSVRERGHFWASRPSDPLLLSVLIGTVVVMILSTFGLLGLTSMPLWAFGLVLAYAMAMCLLVNDAIKVGMMGTWVAPR